MIYKLPSSWGLKMYLKITGITILVGKFGSHKHQVHTHTGLV